jgi:hypothetical protein
MGTTNQLGCRSYYLHGDQPVIHLHLLCQEVCTNSGLVLAAELLVHVLIHQRCLAHTAGGQQEGGAVVTANVAGGDAEARCCCPQGCACGSLQFADAN